VPVEDPEVLLYRIRHPAVLGDTLEFKPGIVAGPGSLTFGVGEARQIPNLKVTQIKSVK
jgi:hypothetical protein